MPKKGDIPARKSMSFSERFWLRVQKSKGCWTWRGNPDRWGYGRFYFGGGTMLAHRASWVVHFNDPGDLNVLHKCNNPICVRPSHLYLGTDRDNTRDRIAAGTQSDGRPGFCRNVGSKHAQSKFTEEDVVLVRAMVKSGFFTRKDVQRIFGVSKTAVRSALLGVSWRHVV